MESNNAVSDEVATLIKQAKSHRDNEARADAIEALAELDPVPEPVIDLFLALLDDKDEDTRCAAIQALEAAQPPRALDRLIAAVDAVKARKSKEKWWDGQEIQDLFSAIGACGPGDAKAIAVLCKHLHIPEYVQGAAGAYDALIAMGPLAEEATELLKDRVANGPPWEVAHAHHALFAIDGSVDAHVPALIELLTQTGDHGSSAAGAAIALEEIGAPALALVEAAAKSKGPKAKAAEKVLRTLQMRAKRTAARKGKGKDDEDEDEDDE